MVIEMKDALQWASEIPGYSYYPGAVMPFLQFCNEYCRRGSTYGSTCVEVTVIPGSRLKDLVMTEAKFHVDYEKKEVIIDGGTPCAYHETESGYSPAVIPPENEDRFWARLKFVLDKEYDLLHQSGEGFCYKKEGNTLYMGVFQENKGDFGFFYTLESIYVFKPVKFGGFEEDDDDPDRNWVINPFQFQASRNISKFLEMTQEEWERK